ncbi:MAG: DUF5011 domain-containing protein, partial [Polaribacter sp.]|nr:DUF5011 domain-containing protein [Polaribacter sp.]
MKNKITLLLVCAFFAVSSAFSQTVNRLAVSGNGSFTVTLTETIPSDHTARFYAGQPIFNDGPTTFMLNTPGEMGVTINGTSGEYFVAVGYKLFSNVGNIEHSAHEVQVRVGDVTAPVINLIGAATQTIQQGGSVTLGATSTDIIGGHTDVLIVNEDLNGLDVDTPGTYTVLYNVTDLSGNSADQVELTVNVISPDITPPTGYSITNATSLVNTGNQAAFSFEIVGLEANASYSWSISDGNNTPLTGSGTWNGTGQVIISNDVSGLNDGTLTVSVTSTDPSNNTGQLVTETTTKDTTPPVISNISMTSSNANTSYAKAGDVITMVFTSNETINTPTVFIAGQPATVSNNGNDWTATITVDGNSNEGSANFTIADISDLASNTTNSIQGTPATTAIIDVTAPAALVTPNPIALNINTNPTLTVQDINDGSNDNITDLQNLTLSIDKTAFSCDDIVLGQVSTQYLVTLTVTDQSGNTSIATKTISVVDDVAPQNVQLVNP